MIYKDKCYFELSGERFEKLMEFQEEHEKCRERFPDSIGALFEYSFIPTGLGDIVTVRCPCGSELDLTDLNF